MDYELENGYRARYMFDEEAKEIDLGSSGWANADFALLSSCTHLQRLILVSNKLKNIDLSPLSS